MEKQAATSEGAAGDPAVAGESAVDSVEAAGMKKAAHHWKTGSIVKAMDWWWAVTNGHG